MLRLLTCTPWDNVGGLDEEGTAKRSFKDEYLQHIIQIDPLEDYITKFSVRTDFDDDSSLYFIKHPIEVVTAWLNSDWPCLDTFADSKEWMNEEKAIYGVEIYPRTAKVLCMGCNQYITIQEGDKCCPDCGGTRILTGRTS